MNSLSAKQGKESTFWTQLVQALVLLAVSKVLLAVSKTSDSVLDIWSGNTLEKKSVSCHTRNVLWVALKTCSALQPS